MGARLQLVVPCYNEAARLQPDAFAALIARCADVSVQFVDDGSTDATAAILARAAAESRGRMSVSTLPRNAGKAVAVRHGIVRAFADSPELVGYWDADLSTPLAAVPAFLDVLASNPAIDVVIGARVKLMGRRIERKAARHYFGRVFATAASIALGVPVYDTQCGAKVFRVTDAVRRVFAAPFESRWTFDVEILARYLEAAGPAAAARIWELPLPAWTDVPGSKLRLRDAAGAIRDLAAIARRRRR